MMVMIWKKNEKKFFTLKIHGLSMAGIPHRKMMVFIFFTYIRRVVLLKKKSKLLLSTSTPFYHQINSDASTQGYWGMRRLCFTR